jgi:hypothetical protein
MARSSAASRDPLSAQGMGPGAPAPRHLPGLKVWLFGVVVASLVAVFSFALGREVATSGQPPVARPAVPTPRPALSAAEENYSLALWPIHNRVKESAIRMSLSGINYKIQSLDPPTFRAQIEMALGVYRQAEGQIRALRPPPSLQEVHDNYLEAIRLYQQAGAEMLKVVDDRDDDHLRIAFPMSQEGGRRLRQVGSVLWPTEYVPN